jgi:hypothetical protein
MQLRLALLDLDLADPPPSPTSTSPPPSPWEQIGEATRIAALELLARLIAGTLATLQGKEMPDE